jgi:hypothetical protein
MAVLDALASKLVTDSVGVLGTSIYLSQLQDETDTAVCLYESVSTGPIHTFGAQAASGNAHRVRAVCRGPKNDYPTARAKAELVRTSLGSIRTTTISGVVFATVLDTSGIYPVGFDKEDRPLLAIDFAVWVQ